MPTNEYGPYTTEQRGGDWIAYMAADHRVWEAGRNELEALGRLVVTMYSAYTEPQRAIFGIKP